MKIDYKAVYREAYGASRTSPALVDVPPMRFLMLDGRGDPQRAPAFQRGAETLFSLAYALRTALKEPPIRLEFAVMPLEALWWSEGEAPLSRNRSDWRWTLMIMQPPVVDEQRVETARAELACKKNLAALSDVRFGSFVEGRAVQFLYEGPYSEAGPAVERLRRFAAERGLAVAGKHHEIYLSDPRRSAPDKWKTILRLPVAACS